MKIVKFHPSDNALLLWVYKKSGQGSILGDMYKIPPEYYGLKIPKDDDGSTIYPDNAGRVKRQSALYIVRKSVFEPLGWGVGFLPCVTLSGEATTVGANGTFCFSVEIPELLYEKTTDMGDEVSIESFRERILSMIRNEIIKSFKPNTIKRLDMVSNAINNCRDNIAVVFSSFGLKLESFTTEGITE